MTEILTSPAPLPSGASAVGEPPAPEAVSEDPTAGLERQQRVYLGRTYFGKVLHYTWQVLLPDASLSSELLGWNKNRLSAPVRIGAIWEFWIQPDTMSTYTPLTGPLRPTYHGLWKDEAQLLAWTLAATEIDLREAEKRRVARDAGHDPIKEALLPIARAMRKTNYQGRILIIARVIQILHSLEGAFDKERDDE